MKTTKLLISGVIAIMFCSCASEFAILSDDVPSVVSSAFKAKYPSAQGSDWEVEKHNGHLVYEVAFKLDGKRKEAAFKPDGTFEKEE